MIAIRILAAGMALTCLAGTACTHELAVRNLSAYASPLRLTGAEVRPEIAILPYTGTPDGLFYFNAIVEQLNANPGIGQVRTDYIASKADTNSFKPDLILSITPTVNYRSSGWNFLINWPGFLIFTPSWNGYVYHADILTQISISAPGEGELATASVPVSYNIRHAELDRTIFTGLTWLEVSLLAFGGGIYNANVFDRDIIGGLQVQVKDNFSTHVTNQLQPKILSAASSLAPRRSAVGGSPPEPSVPSAP